jgi:hypothetical protein
LRYTTLDRDVIFAGWLSDWWKAATKSGFIPDPIPDDAMLDIDTAKIKDATLVLVTDDDRIHLPIKPDKLPLVLVKPKLGAKPKAKKRPASRKKR